MRAVKGSRPLLALAFVAATILSACGGGASDAGGEPSGPAATTGPRPASTAELTILKPKVGAVVHGSAVDLRVDLQGARIVPATTTDIKPDEGHLHVSLDGALISMTEGLEQTILDVTPGLHRIQVEFVASDHAPFDPRVVAVTEFEVKP
jgi:hypothetical protein